MRDLEDQLAAAIVKRDRLAESVDAARARSEAATPGGLTDYDPAVLSGIRRKPNVRAEARRYAAYSDEAELTTRHQSAVDEVAALERAIIRAARPSAPEAAVRTARAGILRSGIPVRIVRASAKSVTVEDRFGNSWRARYYDFVEVAQ